MKEELTEHEKVLFPVLELCKASGWEISHSGVKQDDVIHGMIIGTPAYIEYIKKHLD